MISEAREKEIRDFAERWKDAVKYRPDLHAFSGYCRDLLKDRDEQTERIAALERTLGDMWIDAQDFTDAKLFRVRIIEMIEHVHPPRVTQEKPR